MIRRVTMPELLADICDLRAGGDDVWRAGELTELGLLGCETRVCDDRSQA